MIQLVETKDVEYLFVKLGEINERTKKHTINIRILERELKELKKSLKAN